MLPILELKSNKINILAKTKKEKSKRIDATNVAKSSLLSSLVMGTHIHCILVSASGPVWIVIIKSKREHGGGGSLTGGAQPGRGRLREHAHI